jgi:hypothetical protein
MVCRAGCGVEAEIIEPDIYVFDRSYWQLQYAQNPGNVCCAHEEISSYDTEATGQA